MSKSDAQETVEFAIRSGLANRAHKTGITLDKSQIIIDDIMAELFSPGMVWAIQEYAQQCAHPTAAGGSAESNTSESGGG